MGIPNLIDIPEPARIILEEFAARVLDALPEKVCGIYILGSVPLGDFNPVKSDIDFLTLLRYEPDWSERNSLIKIHQALHSRYPKPDLSGSYLTVDQAESMTPRDLHVWSWHEGRWRQGPFDMAPVVLSELVTHAIPVIGPPGREWQVKIDQTELKNFMIINNIRYWQPWIQQHSRWWKKKTVLFLFPRMTEWSVLGVARQWFTMHAGEIVSKYKAGEMVIGWLPEAHRPVIREALAVRRDTRTLPLLRSYMIRPSISRTRQTLACLEFMAGKIREADRQGGEGEGRYHEDGGPLH